MFKVSLAASSYLVFTRNRPKLKRASRTPWIVEGRVKVLAIGIGIDVALCAATSYLKALNAIDVLTAPISRIHGVCKVPAIIIVVTIYLSGDSCGREHSQG